MANLRPQVSVGIPLAIYSEDNGSMVLSNTLVVADRDSPMLTGATVHFTYGYVQGVDFLAFANQNGITGSWDAATGTLTLSGVSSVANYQAALRSIAYSSSDALQTGLRVIGFTVNDGTSSSYESLLSMVVTGVNDAPVLTVDPVMTYTTFQSPAAVDPGLILADPDSDMAGAVVKIAGNYRPGEDLLTWVNTAHVTGKFDARSGTLVFSGHASVAEYQQVLRGVAYVDTLASPSLAPRTITIQVQDYDHSGPSYLSNVGSVTVLFAAPPDVHTSGTPVAYTEGNPAVTLEPALTLSDIDDPNMAGATVRISAGFDAGDSLVFTSTANISGSYDGVTGVLTLTGSAPIAEYQAALRSIQFVGTSDDPSSRKTITWVVNDGTDNSTPVTTTINVTPVNDAPTLSIGATLNYTENDAATPIAPTATLSDPDSHDFKDGSLKVGFTANATSADQLTVIDQGTGPGQIGVSGNTISYGGVAIGTFSGGANGADLVITFNSASATLPVVEALVRDIGFRNTSDDPSTLPRTVNFTVVDGDGGTDTGSGTASINVTSVNDAPVLAGSSVTPLAYTENDPAKVIDGGITIADIDSATLTGATVTISSNYQGGEDVLGFTDTANIHGNYANGVLTLSGNASVAEYQDALRSITYQNTSDNPSGATRTITYQVDDGSASHNLSSDVSRDVTVTPVNDAPTLSIGDTLAYTENGPATPIAVGAMISDADSPNFNGGSLWVGFTANGLSQDQLTIINQGTAAGQIGVSGSSVTYAGTTIGTFTGGVNATPLVITFNSDASPAAVQALVRDIGYSNTSDNPFPGARTVGYTLVDGGGTALGGSDTATASATIHVTAVNDAPTIAPSGTAAAYTEGGAAAVLDASIALSDLDDINLESATVSITGNFQPGDTLVFASQNGITSSYNNGTGVLLLTGTATVAQYQAALRSITFQSSSHDPATSKTITWTVSDGTDNSDAQTSTIAVTPVNDAPVVTPSGPAASYTEGGTAAVLDATITIADPDNSTLASATITITSGLQSGDQLVFTDQNGITGNYSAASGTLTLTGTATVAQYQAALASVTFQTSNDNPAASKTITWIVNDGTDPSAAQTSTIDITPVNDAPTVTTSGGNAAWTEAGPAAAIDPSIAIADPDNTTLSSATVQISSGFLSGHDVLAFTNAAGMGNIVGSYNATSGTLTLTSSGASATLAQWQAALASVTFDSDSNSPGASRTISFQLNDGSATSNIGTKSIAITEVNSAPTVTTTGGSAAFVENAAAVAIDSGIVVADADSANLAGATVHIGTGFHSGQDDLAADTTGTSITASYDAATGTLTLTGSDTVAHYEAVLASVTYNNTSDTPDTTARTIEFQVDDGQGVDNLSSVATRTVTVAATNDPPVVTVGATLAYTENDAATAIAPLATVTDPDSANFNGGSLTVSFTANGAPEDQLSVLHQGGGSGQIGVSGSNVSYEGTTIGTVAGGVNGASLVITFNSAATQEAVQALMRDIAYANSSESPSNAPRTVKFEIVDGGGGTDTGSGTAAINITALNDAPVLAGSTVTPLAYTENDPAKAIDSGITITDVDSTTLASATVTISSNYQNGQDVLAFNTAGTSITGSFNATTGAVTFTGTDTLAHYQQVLRSVTYQNTSENPSAATRTVTYEVNDGSASHNLSNDVTRDITVTPVNDAPAIIAGNTIIYTENAPGTVISGGLALSDAEGDNITGATVSISSNFQAGQDILGFTDTGNIHGSYDAATGVMTLTGTDSAANYQAALESVTYANSSDNPITTGRTISFSATDSHGDTGSAATATVNITAVDDAPVNTVPADASLGTAFSNTAMSISGVSVSDIDANSGVMTVTLSATNGGLTVTLAGGASISGGANGSGTVTLSGSVSALNSTLASLSYKSADGFIGTETITVTTNDAGNTGTGGPKTDVDSFHVGVVPQVWVIDASAPAGGDGSPSHPFSTIAAFNASGATGAGDYVYIKAGTYSESDGLNLKTGMKVYGDGSQFTLENPVTHQQITFGSNNPANSPVISVTGASNHGIDLAQENTIQGLKIVTNAGTQVGISDGNGTVGTLNISGVDVTGAGQAVDIDQGGDLHVSFGTLSSTGSSAQGVQLAGTAGTTLSGTFSAASGTISGSASTGFLVGDGSGTANTGGTFKLDYGGSISTTGAARAVDIEDRSASASAVTFSGSVSHSSGDAVGILIDDVAGGAITFSGANTLATGSQNAIQASDITGGSLTFSGDQTLTTSSGTGISLSTNSAAVGFTGSAVSITTGSGLTSGGGTGLLISSNTGSVTFNNTGAGLDISTPKGGTGVSVSNSGTLVIQGTGNSITSTSGTAISVVNTTIGASGLNFQSISSSGAANGIVLNNTGSAGGLTVTGTGTAGSGGTISGAAADAVSVTSGVFNLGYMQIVNPNQSGIDVSNLIGSSSLDHSTISGFGATSGNSITGNAINVVNTGSNSGTLTVSNSTISNGTNGNDGIFMEAQGSGTMYLVVNNDTLTGLYGDGVQVNGTSTATSAIHTTIQNSTFQNAIARNPDNSGGGSGGVQLNPFGQVVFYADVNGNTFNGVMNSIANTGAVGVSTGSSADAEVTIRNNKISNIGGGRGITVFNDGNGINKYLIDGNWIDNLAVPGPSGKAAISVTFNNDAGVNPSGSVTVSNNQIGQHGSINGVLWTNTATIGASGMNNDAITLGAINGATMTSAVTNNIVSANTSFDDVIVYATLGGTMNATISGNTLTDTAGTHSEITAQAGTGSTVNVSIGSNALPAGSSAVIFLAATGTMYVTQASAAAISSTNSGATMNVSGSPIYSHLPAPGSPSTPSLPMLAGEGSADSGAYTLTMDDLAGAIAAAATRWEMASSLTDEQILRLASLKFVIGDLEGDAIGAETPGLIVLDGNAGGRGWFVDSTPLDDSEFGSNGTATHLYGLSGAAGTQMDLLTVVMHEMGHALGLSDLYGAQDQNDVMYGYLNAGERLLPAAHDVPVTLVAVDLGGGA